MINFTAEEKENGLDVGTLLRYRGVSKRLITKLKRAENGIMLNGEHTRTIDRVKAGDIVSVFMSDERKLEANNRIKVPVLYEDDDVVVFDKPVDMPVHPSIKHQGDTLGNCFAAMYPDLTFRPVNRLDKDTSGLCAVAKNAHAANLLQGTLKKVYYAAVCGKIEEDGRIEAPIGRTGDSIIKREVRPDGQQAVTDYTIIKGNEQYTLLRVLLRTGRTHQIRVHFSYIGHPLAGDDFYGGSVKDIAHQALHCGELEFISPVTGENVHVVSPIRTDIEAIL
ncbi:MAG: RluA family pseudouridine synthase [Oscillospiraceae bacterium]|nr:RluA family pseudouridine synthase [Oscillospiraceae bacterium]